MEVVADDGHGVGVGVRGAAGEEVVDDFVVSRFKAALAAAGRGRVLPKNHCSCQFLSNT